MNAAGSDGLIAAESDGLDAAESDGIKKIPMSAASMSR